MSDSLTAPSSAIRALSWPEYHTRSVCEPVISELRSALPSPPTLPGSGGRPRSARSTTVPDTPSSRAVCRSTRSWAALRGASRASAEARSAVVTAPPPRTTTSTPAGTAHRSTGRDAITDMGTSSGTPPSCATAPVPALRPPQLLSGNSCQARGMRVLVVEDEPRLARALQRGLTAEGYAVDLAADGLAGLEAARH